MHSSLNKLTVPRSLVYDQRRQMDQEQRIKGEGTSQKVAEGHQDFDGGTSVAIRVQDGALASETWPLAGESHDLVRGLRDSHGYVRRRYGHHGHRDSMVALLP